MSNKISFAPFTISQPHFIPVGVEEYAEDDREEREHMHIVCVHIVMNMEYRKLLYRQKCSNIPCKYVVSNTTNLGIFVITMFFFATSVYQKKDRLTL
jgi:hypothetical protein